MNEKRYKIKRTAFNTVKDYMNELQNFIRVFGGANKSYIKKSMKNLMKALKDIADLSPRDDRFYEKIKKVSEYLTGMQREEYEYKIKILIEE